MTYLTHIVLDTSDPAGFGLETGTPDLKHRAIAKMVGASADDQGRCLWRHERGALWVLSAGEPQQMPGARKQRTADMNPLLRRISVGDRYAFRLRANPTLSTANGSGKRGRREPIIRGNQQIHWLNTRNIGAEVLESHRTDSTTYRFTKGSDRKVVTVVAADFAGTLRVKDADQLRAAMIGGIGRGKAYGCGLLLLGGRLE